MFHESRAPAYRSMRRVVRRLEKTNIAYAILGGMALDAYGVRRAINGVHVLKVYYINLTTLIQLKLATRRSQDLADVVSLINAHLLDETIAERLHLSLRRDYFGCLEEIRREEAFIARNG